MSFFDPKDGARSLSELLPEFARENGWQKNLEQHSLFIHWNKIVDHDVAAFASPLKIVQNVLWIEVENSAWMQQFQYQKIEILQACNEFLSDDPLSDIRLVLRSEQQKKQEHTPAVKFIPPPEEDIQEFEKIAAAIKDEDSRKALVQFWYLCHACNRL